jgi:hypothetical protein
MTGLIVYSAIAAITGWEYGKLLYKDRFRHNAKTIYWTNKIRMLWDFDSIDCQMIDSATPEHLEQSSKDALELIRSTRNTVYTHREVMWMESEKLACRQLIKDIKYPHRKYGSWDGYHDEIKTTNTIDPLVSALVLRHCSKYS